MSPEHGGDKGDKTSALWGGDCTTSDWMIDGSGRSNQGLSASTVCLSGPAEGVSARLAQRGTHSDCTFLPDRERKWDGTGREEAGFDAAAYYKVTIAGCQEKPHNHGNRRARAFFLNVIGTRVHIFLKQTAVSCSRGSRDGCRFSLFNERFDRKRPHPRGCRGGARLGKHVATSPAPPSHN